MQPDSNTTRAPSASTAIDKLEKATSILLRVLSERINNHIFSLKGIDREGKACWHYVLVDWDKRKKFLEDSQTGTVCAIDYGKIVALGSGHEVPKEVLDKQEQFLKSFRKSFHLIYLGRDKYVKTYYVLADVDKELQIKAVSSEGEIKCCGRILYSTNDDDPAEALAYVIEEEYFDFEREIILDKDSPIDAVVNGQVGKVKEYLDAGGDANCTDRRGWTLLHHFAQRNNVDVLSLLKSKGADIQVRDRICGRKPVLIATREGHIEAIEFFLKNGASVNEMDKNNWTLAHYAAWNGNLNTIKFLIQKNAKIDAKEITAGKLPIHISAEYGNTDVLKIFLEKGVNIEAENDLGRSPLFHAVNAGQEETCKYLISVGAKINNSIAHAAATSNNVEVMELLLAKGQSINQSDSMGVTLLHRAVGRGKLEMIKYLVDKKANLTAVSTDGITPFNLSTHHPEVALYLGNKIGTELQEKEEYEEALSVYRVMHDILKKKLSGIHPEALEIQNQVATMLYKLSRYDEAVATFKLVLEARDRCLGSIHIDTLCTKHRLGLVYRDQIKYDNALEIFEDVFEKRKECLSPDHHFTLCVARDMANLHFRNGKYDKAYNIFEDVYKRRRAHFGEDHPETLQVSHDMAMALLNNGNYKKALEILDWVLQKRINTLGNNDPLTLSTKHDIKSISKTFEPQLKEKQGCLIL